MIGHGVPGESLYFVDTERVIFGDDWYRSVNIDRFFLPVETGGDAALNMLLQDPRYVNVAAHQGDEPSAEPGHGIYRMDQLSPQSYEAVTSREAVNTMRQFADEDDVSIDSDIRGELQFRVYRYIALADYLYRLKDLEYDARHDLMFYVDRYTELVVVDTQRSELRLIVGLAD